MGPQSCRWVFEWLECHFSEMNAKEKGKVEDEEEEEAPPSPADGIRQGTVQAVPDVRTRKFYADDVD